MQLADSGAMFILYSNKIKRYFQAQEIGNICHLTAKGKMKMIQVLSLVFLKENQSTAYVFILLCIPVYLPRFFLKNKNYRSISFSSFMEVFMGKAFVSLSKYYAASLCNFTETCTILGFFSYNPSS